MKRGKRDLDLTIKSLQTRAAKYPITKKEASSSQEIIDTLFSKGWYKGGSLFSDKINLIDNIQDKLDYYLDKGGDSCKYALLKGEEATLPQSKVKEKELFMSVKKPLYNVPEIADILFDDRILDIAKCYFKCVPAVGTINLRKSFANNLPSVNTTMYHCDTNSPYMLKVFLYLNDVDEIEDGPFTYVEGSAYEKPEGWSNDSNYRLKDKTIEKIYGKDRIKHLTAKKGDVLIAINTGYHKGQKVVSKDRSMLTLNFVCAPEEWSAENYTDIKPETCRKIEPRNEPLIDFMYVVE
tara:strand:- start:1535 stop:2416 length:882 start_codon:yes stop_codon:yes gene_type:complete